MSDDFDSWTVNHFNGKPYSRVGWFATDGKVRLSAVYKLSSELKAGKNYTVSFDIINRCIPKADNIQYSRDASVQFFMYLSPSITNLDNAVDVFSFDTKDNITEYNIQFTYPENFSGSQVYLICMIIGSPAMNMGDKLVGSALLVDVSDFVFTDNDNSDEKIDGILEWLSAVYHSIVGGEDSRGVKHDGLVQGIKNGLASLGNTIGGFFENLKISIENKIDAIQQWFVELGENIIDGIKSLFIPEDGYFESKKAELEDFFAEHFGIVYTAGSLSIDVLKKFTSLKPPAQAVLHVPAWQMQLPWESDKIITIVPAMDVNFSEYINASGVLHTLYSFYRAFITVVIIFMVVNYAKRKFDYVFGKDGEGVE